MKILVTNFYLENLTGSELYTIDLCRALKQKGHEVVVYAPISNGVADMINTEGMRVVKDIGEIKNETFDVIHVHHNICALMVRSFFPNIPMVFLSHGIIPDLEQPPSIDLNISRFIAVSEEVESNLVEKHHVPPHKVEIIRNFVDTDRFQPTRPINNVIRKVLVISNHYGGQQKEVIEGACKTASIDLEVIGMGTKPVLNVADYINRADLVITLGRGVLEAMACGREVIVYDYLGGDGIIRQNNFPDIRSHNFSGRKWARQYSSNDLVKEIKKFDAQQASINRQLILKEHSLLDTTERLLAIYGKAQEEFHNIDIKLPSIEINFLLQQLSKTLSDLRSYSDDNKSLRSRLEQIESSPSWRLASFLHKLRLKIPIIKNIKR
ncbi:MAG: glycosyltransferase family 4 protein [Patescibacteria group bacterium]